MDLQYKSVYQCLKNAAAEEGSRRFLFNEKREISFSEAFDGAVMIANKLYASGVRNGDVLAFRMTRSVDSMIIFFATQMIGAVTALIDPHNKVEKFIDDCGIEISPSFIITNENLTYGISANGGWEIIDKRIGKSQRLTVEKPVNCETPLFNVEIDTAAPSIILFTSGSTGKNKASVLSQEAFILAEYTLAKHCRYEKSDVLIALLPLCHMYALSVIVFTCITIKYELFIPENTQPKDVLESIDKFGVTLIIGVPSLLVGLAEAREDSNVKTSLYAAMTAGAPCTPKQFDFIEEKLNLKLYPAYGMTEGINFTACSPYDDIQKRKYSVGNTMPLRECVILNEKGEKMSCGKVGEICVKSPFHMLGYYGDEKATKEVIDKLGYLHTGDLGYVDEDGFFYITGRKKDIIIRNGNNISVVQVEQNIELLDCVRQVAVVGIADEKVGEVPCAAIVLKDGVNITEEELNEKMRGVLQKNEIPAKILLLDKLPLLPTGKVDKIAIKQLIK